MVNYDLIFKDPLYNPIQPELIKLVEKWLDKKDKILDVGCGRGHYLKHLLKKGYNVTGLEPSEYLIKHDLKGFPVIHGDIYDITEDYDTLFAMDVMEHLHPDFVEESLAQLVIAAPKALYGIANHPDRWENQELHLIQEDAKWWHELLLEYYPIVKNIFNSERYFIFEAKNV